MERRQNVRRSDGYGSKQGPSKEGFMLWKTKLFSVFVGKLSTRVSERALWELFSLYGRVVDVYFPVTSKVNRERRTGYAFVRYKFEYEMRRAIQEGNNRKVDGWRIRVERAFIKRREMKSPQKGLNPITKNDYGIRLSFVANQAGLRDHRSYRDVVAGRVLGAVDKGKEEGTSMKTKDQEIPNVVEVSGCQQLIFDELYIPKEDLESLGRSTIGHFKELRVMDDFYEYMRSEEAKCKVYLLDEVLSRSDQLAKWFDSICKCSQAPVNRKALVWVRLAAVPLQVWHINLFKMFGDS
ncbi:hypothetical protein DITRI_Ditri17bG0032900 [Diplodiscus trichospermus]